MLTYKGYTGRFEIDFEANIIFGQLVGIRDVVTFQAESVEEVVKEFHNSVDDYLEFISEYDNAV